MKYLSEEGCPCWVTVLCVRYEGFPLAVFLYHIKCYVGGYYVGILARFLFFYFYLFFLGRSQPFCSVGFPVRLSAWVV